jgi:shikimate dehydrogenase
MRCAVLGDPVAHSLSPTLHRAGYAAAGLTGWEYDAVRVPEGGLGGFLGGLGPEWRGLSLTMPLKREALDVALQVTTRARLAGAVNTLVLESGVPVLADNTDLPGAAAALRERWDGPVDRVAVLGGGATAASAALALCDQGARSIVLLARSPARAEQTRSAIARHPSGPSVVAAPLGSATPSDVLVSTIPAAAQTPDLVERFTAPVVFEVVYDPWPTPVAAAALERGAVLVGGLDLLVHQAVLQLELFTGVPAPVEALRAAGEAALAARRPGP